MSEQDTHSNSSSGTSRRAVVRGLAWSAPAVSIAAAAPALAVSPRCFVPVVMDWSSARYTRYSATRGVYTTADPDGTGPLQPLTLTVANSYLGSNTQTGNQARNVNDNLAVRSGTIGGARNPLVLHQSPVYNSNKTNTRVNANKSITTFTFDRPVSGLTFTITDIDSTTSDFVDAVGIESASPFRATKVNESWEGEYPYQGGVQGTGTLADPLRANGWNTMVPESETRGNATIAFTQDVTSFRLHYWNQTAASDPYIDGDQRVFLSNFQMTYNACP